MTTPVLSYVGSVDTTRVTSGVDMFNLLFDSSITGVLMFEYQIYVSSDVPTPDNVVTGFINPDSAQTAGISNQWLLPIPAGSNIYSPGTVVRVRVYPSNGLNVTTWSNQLYLYNPPNAPTIVNAKYDINQPDQRDDMLWALLADVSGNGSDLKYILAYYYVDTSGVTVWQVSEPTVGDILTNGQVRVGVPINNDVSITTHVVYVAAHAVFEFYDDSENAYYTVSEISNTFYAYPAEYTAPVLEPLIYTYQDQNINLTWRPPSSSFIQPYEVSSYDIMYYTNVDPTPILIDNVDGNTLTYDYVNETVGRDACGTTMNFYVVANSSTASDLASNTQNTLVFYAATAPNGLLYNWAVFDGADFTSAYVNFTFRNPTNLGCGTQPHFTWQIVDNLNAVVQSGLVLHINVPTHMYDVTAQFTYNANYTYIIKVFAVTTDVNSPAEIDGVPNTSSAIVPTEVPYIYNIVKHNGGYGNNVTFNVTSRVAIAPICEVSMLVLDGENTSIQTAKFEISPDNSTYGTHDQIYNYSVTLYWSACDPEIPGTTVPNVPDYFILYVANSSGIGSGVYPAPI